MFAMVTEPKVASLPERHCNILPFGNQCGGEFPCPAPECLVYFQGQSQSSCCSRRVLSSVFLSPRAPPFEVSDFGCELAQPNAGVSNLVPIGKAEKCSIQVVSQVTGPSSHEKTGQAIVCLECLSAGPYATAG